MMNWSAIAASDYTTAVGSLRYVAFDLGKMVAMLRREGVRDIHAIGFSLGDHVTGIAGYYLGWDKFNRITGLDPAKSFLINVPLKDKLDATDAYFVDVYHTEMIVEGQSKKCGHVDFYVNWGGIQPGCGNLDIVCSHLRAPIYFTESIISNVGFWGFPINPLRLVQIRSPWILAGEYVDKNALGSYYVATNSHYPYTKGRSF
ncbi:pancreatic lipase-related protein 2-like [Cotesia typhae]|uniref:pancreatic lipase-related protein 2-like n=1 Tax=Cotesia typhae TaxID=2053667 RepID=UPI003D694C12